jgi:hypothetical protein
MAFTFCLKNLFFGKCVLVNFCSFLIAKSFKFLKVLISIKLKKKIKYSSKYQNWYQSNNIKMKEWVCGNLEFFLSDV